MAYDEDLADLLRAITSDLSGVSEKRMFGALAFLLDGHMTVVASGRDGMMVRVPHDDTETLLAEPHAGPMVMRDKEMKGWLLIDPAGCTTEDEVRPWVDRAVAFVRTLPPK